MHDITSVTVVKLEDAIRRQPIWMFLVWPTHGTKTAKGKARHRATGTSVNDSDSCLQYNDIVVLIHYSINLCTVSHKNMLSNFCPHRCQILTDLKVFH